jgi:hypothetical protein
MSNGSVVSAEYAGRKARDKLGSLLVRGALITQEQLDEALGVQKRTLRRLGDILVDLGMVTKEQLRDMTSLQTTQTLYKLFHWKAGTYAFEPREVAFDRETVSPLRCEAVLMEGYRLIDEWPIVRRKITSTALTFDRVKLLDPAVARAEGTASLRHWERTSGGRTSWPFRASPWSRSPTCPGWESSRPRRRSSTSSTSGCSGRSFRRAGPPPPRWGPTPVAGGTGCDAEPRR